MRWLCEYAALSVRFALLRRRPHLIELRNAWSDTGGEKMLSIQTIIHPTDFSERSEYAFHLACALARDYGARLIALHVWFRPTLLYGEAVPYTDDDYAREA